MISTVPLVLLALPPLAVAAGVDLYLTLLFLGAAPALGWWEVLPGALGDLNSTGVLVMVGAFYLLELTAELFPSAALFWNAFHAIIRPLAGALLALLLLDGQPIGVTLPGALTSGLLASVAHATRAGGGVLFWLDSRKEPHRLLVALLEDACVLGLVTLTLDRPDVALGVATLVFLGSLKVVGSQVRAFAFAVELVWARVWLTLGQPHWTDPEDFPGWVRQALKDDVMAPGGGLRGSPAAGHRLPGAPGFTTGWVVVRGDTPLYVFRRRARTGEVDLGPLRTREVTQGEFFRRVELSGPATANLYFRLDGPSAGSLRAEFLGP